MPKNNPIVIKIIESVCFPVGAALVALHFFSWKSDKSGIYYESINEWGIAAGVMLITVGWVARKWV